MTILVTGATGNVGREIVHQLLRQNQPVRALTRNPLSAKLPREVEVVTGDLSRPETLTTALDGVTAMHWISVYENEVLDGIHEVATRVKDAGVERVTIMTGGGDETVIEAAKRVKLSYTHLQPGEFMTNTLLWAGDIRSKGIVRAPFGEQLSAMIHEADIAAVAVRALCENGHEGMTYLLTGNEELTRRERIEQLGAAVGIEIDFIELSAEEARNQWLNEGYTIEQIEWLLELGEWECISPATDSIEQITGRPARTFYEWAREHADDFR